MHFVNTGRQFRQTLPAQVIVVARDGDGRRLRSALELVGALVTMALFLGVAILL